MGLMASRRFRSRPRHHGGRIVAKGGHNVLYYENIEGGHAAATTNEQRAFIDALQFAYLLGELK